MTENELIERCRQSINKEFKKHEDFAGKILALYEFATRRRYQCGFRDSIDKQGADCVARVSYVRSIFEMKKDADTIEMFADLIRSAEGSFPCSVASNCPPTFHFFMKSASIDALIHAVMLKNGIPLNIKKKRLRDVEVFSDSIKRRTKKERKWKR